MHMLVCFVYVNTGTEAVYLFIIVVSFCLLFAGEHDGASD
jgi:hypothetical protein